ncbi:UvrD-helicase domain-containing protein [Gloeobacter kilaueensis]|uniref:ATP-dependent DNA helicase Rep n=1 Tax=Gloeobacter kilaueensis (strain ATCC BAA-2537 / CCAP 1431/1 / ULC 316 / JS1) TaxID=1183438 RepID=U5QGK1_GLOK1|nr:UvrD-helicase domain-containing protein [Gloeobacter kilaueensis]AGY57998.1 ATP-dependent DNA helicase Rep [Gloeobacter kilaueensis JS1]
MKSEPDLARQPDPDTLTDEQESLKEFFLTSNESFRVEAPPGSGKTHLLKHLLLDAPHPQLVCMFSHTAQQTLARRLMVSPEPTPHRVTTFHSMAMKLTEVCWEVLGFPSKPHHIHLNEPPVTAEDEFQPQRIAARRARATFTYNDSLYYLLQVLRRKLFRLRYPALLVDEYQDTNAVQWAIIEALMAQGPQRLVLLGDQHQCIYQFLSAQADHPLAEGLTVKRLTYSYRCLSRVCELASYLVGEPFRGNPGGTVQLHHFQRVGEFCERATRLLRTREARSAAILCRTNRMVDDVRAYLAANRIPVAGKTPPLAVSFWSHPAVTWAIDFLENPLLRWPTALPYLSLSQGFRTLEAMERPPATLPSEEAARAIQFARAVQSMHDAPTVRDSLELVDFLLTFPADWVDFIHTLKTQTGQIRSHADLLRLRDTKIEPYKSPGVEVLTIHASKGREWQHVIVDAGLPANAVWAQQKFTAYVGVTRAEAFVDVLCPYFGNSWDIDHFAFD